MWATEPREGRCVMGPIVGSEMASARIADLLAEAASDGRIRRRRPARGWRARFGSVLVSAGFRLIEGRG